VTAAAARDLDEDLPPLEAALASWDRGRVVTGTMPRRLERYRLALLRSTWDYTERVARIPRVLRALRRRHAAAEPRARGALEHGQALPRCARRAGVDIVPSFFIEPGQSPERMPEHGEFVVKPAIGAGSRDAQRYVSGERAAALAPRAPPARPGAERAGAALPRQRGRPWRDGADLLRRRLQPRHPQGPLLRRGEGPTEALFAAEQITPRTPSAAELALGERTLRAMPFGAPLLYARVDLIHDPSGRPRVLELELTEPSLFFAHGPGSAGRFAEAALRRCAEAHSG
jgi:O-ureido-D-serine cyclo-ligase